MVEDISGILRDVLNLGDRTGELTSSTPLLGSLPEFDSMAVVSVLTRIEEDYGIMVDDDEISADIFETVGSLVAFVEHKVGS